MNTQTLDETFLDTRHICDNCSVYCNTNTGRMGTGAAPVRESEYTFYNEASSGQELSKGLHLLGFYYYHFFLNSYPKVKFCNKRKMKAMIEPSQVHRVNIPLNAASY